MKWWNGVLISCFSLVAMAAETEHKTADHKEANTSHKASQKDHAHWAYDGEHGAEHWGDMKAEFVTCKIGKEQSPINIESQHAESAVLPPLQTAYTDSMLAIINNGHTVQVNYKGTGIMAIGNDSYQLLQFHFHTPSEEKIDGKAADMVVHFVHKSAKGELAVIGVLIERGKENAALASVFKKLPSNAGGEQIFGEVFVPFSAILPSSRAYYTFKGSLTTPPCSENVRWFVLKEKITVSEAQLKAFTALYPMNARPVQPLNARKIQQSQ